MLKIIKKRGAKKGSTPWNKDTKGLCFAWNKGKGRLKIKDCLDCNLKLKSVYAIRCKKCAGKKNMEDSEKKNKIGLISKLNTGAKRTLETKKKISESRKGKTTKENHPKWIHDRSKLKDDHKDRGGQLHREWSKNVKNRDFWKCKINNSDCFGKLESHHILSWKEYKNLRYSVDNGITLCKFHHPRKRSDENRLISFFKNIINKQN